MGLSDVKNGAARYSIRANLYNTSILSCRVGFVRCGTLISFRFEAFITFCVLTLHTVSSSVSLVGTVPEAFGLSPRQFKQLYNVEMPDPEDSNIVFQCRAGVRSRQALRDVHKHGFTKYEVLG